MKQELAEILEAYRGQQGALIPILQEVQAKLGYLSEETVDSIAKFLRTTKNEVFGVLTFYAQFRTKPIGKNLIRVCRGTACHVKGADRVRDEVERTLGVKAGETTPDLEYTLETVACIGACALAPTMVINQDTFGQVTTSKVAEILGRKKS